MIETIIYKIFGKPLVSEDKGLRGDKYGNLYVDKTVFYLREDVRAEIEKVKNSEIIKQMIESHRRVWK